MLAALTACGPSGPETPQPSQPNPEGEQLFGPLRIYQRLDFLVGGSDFPAVGRFVFLPGPGDSTFAILALSLPNSALRFRRDGSGFVARYEVDVAVGDSAAPLAALDEVQEVRVRTFRETSRREESIIFQGFLKLPPGEYPARIEVRDLASAAGFISEPVIDVPRFDAGTTSAPIVVYQTIRRESTSKRWPRRTAWWSR